MAGRKKQRPASPPTRESTETRKDWRSLNFHSWEMEYDEDEWRVPASDEHGHSSRSYFRMSPAMERMIEVIVQGRRFPYRTSSDLIRHAVFRHLGWLHKIEPEYVPNYWGILSAITELVRDDERATDVQKVFEILTHRIDDALDKGDTGKAFRLTGMVRSKVGLLQDSDWKDRFLKKFKAKYHGLLHMAPPPAIDEGDNED